MDREMTISVIRTSDPMMDGKALFRYSMYKLGTRLYVSGAGDDLELGVGKGPLFELYQSEVGSNNLEFYFIDWVQLGGGEVWYQNFGPGDNILMEVHCPATPVTPNGGGTGNANVVDHVIVPAAGNGYYDVDLDEANLVPSEEENGYWDWDCPDIGRGTITPSVTPGQAEYHLLDVTQQLSGYVNRIVPLGTGHSNYTYVGIDPSKILPHWKGKVILVNASGNSLALSWSIVGARVRTF
jgi:hypothetical protein